MSYKLIDAQNTKELLKKDNSILIDVRSYEEYIEGHIKGCVLIPLDEVYTTNELPIKKDTNIIVYCKKGIRSRNFCYILSNMGFSNLYDLGAISNWDEELVKN